MPRIWLAFVASITVLLPSVALATAPRYWVVVAVGSESPADAERKLRDMGKPVVAPVTDTESAKQKRADAADALAKAIDRVRALYLEEEYGAGIIELESTEQTVLPVLLATDSGRALLVELNLWIGALHVASDAGDSARERFRLAMALDESAALDAAFWPPAYLEQFDAARASRPGSGSLVVTTTPAARVFVDGVRVESSSPSRAETGLHYVRAERIGHRSSVKLSRVSSAGVDTLRIGLLPLSGFDIGDDAAIATSWYAEQPVAAARAIAAAAGADEVVVVTASGVVLHDDTGKQIGSAANIDLLFGRNPVGPNVEQSKPLYKKWWFWTAVGKLAIAAGGGAYLYWDSQRDPVFEF